MIARSISFVSLVLLLPLVACEQSAKQTVNSQEAAVSASEAWQPDSLPTASEADTAKVVEEIIPLEPSPAARQAAWLGVVTLPDTVLPAGIHQPGRVLEMKRWNDSTGQQLLIVTRTPPKVDYKPGDRSEEGDILEDGDIRLYASTQWLYIRQYRRVDETWQEIWHMQDVLNKCFFDRWIGTLPGATSVTDLDNDGQTETTVVYMLSCRSDVSASALKLIMREGKAKYALRGFTLLNVPANQYRSKAQVPICCNDTVKQDADYGKYSLFWFGVMNGHEGMYFNEKEFIGAPASFLQFAREEWRYWRIRDRFDLQ